MKTREVTMDQIQFNGTWDNEAGLLWIHLYL